MKTYTATVQACQECHSKKDNKTFYTLHLVEESSGYVYRAFSDTFYEKGEDVEIIANYPRYGSASLIEQ